MREGDLPNLFRLSRAVTGVCRFCVLRAICDYLLLHLQTEIARAGPGARGPGLHNCDVWRARRARARGAALSVRLGRPRGARGPRPHKCDLIYLGSNTGNCPISTLTAPPRSTGGVTDVRPQLTQWMPGFWSSGRSEWRLPRQPSSVWLGCRRSASSSPPRPRRSTRAP